MIRSAYYILLSIIIICSCESKIDDNYNIEYSNIEFTATNTTEYTTKGSIIDSCKNINSIGLFAIKEGEIYVDNVDAIKGNNSWSLPSNNRWPIDGSELDFYIYSPYCSNSNGLSSAEISSKGDYFSIRYKVPEIVEDQPDLLVAEPLLNKTSDDLLCFNMIHMLSCVGFNVIGDGTSTITEIEIKGELITEATLEYSSNGGIDWEGNEVVTSVNYKIAIDEVIPSTESEKLNSSDAYLMMIPQELKQELSVIVKVDDGYDNTEELNLTIGTTIWVAGNHYTYVINLDNKDISYEIEQQSNCYMINPNDNITTYYIPIDERIAEFWSNYATGVDNVADNIITTDNYKDFTACELWSDADCSYRLACDIVIDGFKGKEIIFNNISSYKGDYTTKNCKVALKVSLSGMSQGNFVIAIKNCNNIVWSWHFWVTDYNPYEISEEANTLNKTQNTAVPNGAVHRYRDRRSEGLWCAGGEYDGKFIMDRDLGAREVGYVHNYGEGVTFYQFGRKDPFVNNCSSDIEYSGSSQQTLASSVMNPLKITAQRGNWCTEANDRDYIWNDMNTSILSSREISPRKKSIFDPSPLGWKVPLRDTWSDFERDSYDYAIYDASKYAYTYPNYGIDSSEELNFVIYPLNGYRVYSYNYLYDSGYGGHYWSCEAISAKYSAALLYYGYYNYEISAIDREYRAASMSIRCVQE